MLPLTLGDTDVHYWAERPEEEWGFYERFPDYLCVVWEHVGLPRPTKRQQRETSMTVSTTDAFFVAPGATTPLVGTEDVHMMQGQQMVQCHLVDLMNGLETSKGGKPTVTGSKGGNAALTSVLAALVTLGLITDTTS
jgi:hypothetical protein